MAKLKTRQKKSIFGDIKGFVNIRKHIARKTLSLITENGTRSLFTANIGEKSFHMVHSKMIALYMVKGGSS